MPGLVVSNHNSRTKFDRIPEPFCIVTHLFLFQAGSQAKVQESLMGHLYEELVKRKALVEQVNKLQSELSQLGSGKTVPEKSASSSLPSTRIPSSMNTRPTSQTVKAVTTPSTAGVGPVASYAKPLASVTSIFSSSPTHISKPSVVMSIASGVRSSSLHYSATQPRLFNSYQPVLRPVVGVPVQMVSYLDKDGKLISPVNKTKQAKQKGGAKKKPRLSQQPSKAVVTVTLPPSPAVLNPQTLSTVTSPTTPTGCVWQSPSVSRPHQPVMTSPVTPVSASGTGSELKSAVTLVTSPVTPTPVRHVTSDLSSVVPLPAVSVPSSTPQRSSSEVPPMVSFAQNGISYISPLSPLSSMSIPGCPPSSGATPLSSLSASTEKYLNTFTTQSSVAPKPSFSCATRSPSVSASHQLSYSSRSPFLNTDLSTDHSAGIKLLCDLLNDTLPEQPPPLVATSLAVRYLGTPTSLESASSIPDSSKVEQRRHTDTPPAPSSKNASKSPRTPPIGSAALSQSPGGVSSSVEQTTSVQKTPPNSGTSPASKKRTSPFTIENLVSSSPESQLRKSKSCDEAEMGKRHPSPASTSNRSSPKSKNKSPSTNFSIAHITRDMNTVNSTSKGNASLVTAAGATHSVPTSVSSVEIRPQPKRTSPPVPRISNPESDGSRVESSDVISLNAVQSSTGSGAATAMNIQRQRVTAPEARVCSPPTEKNSHVHSSLVSNELSWRCVPSPAPVHGGKTDRPISSLQAMTTCISGDPQLSCPSTGCSPSSSKEDQPVSSEVSSTISFANKISSSASPEHRRDSSSTDNMVASVISEIPLDMIPLPSGKRPSPDKTTIQTDSAGKKRCSPVPPVPKSTSPDSEVSSLMTNESLPQSPSISSSVSKAAVLEGQAPVLVDSNPCSARSPIPVAPSSMLQPQAGVSLPSFGSVFSLAKEEAASSEDSTARNR